MGKELIELEMISPFDSAVMVVIKNTRYLTTYCLFKPAAFTPFDCKNTFTKENISVAVVIKKKMQYFLPFRGPTGMIAEQVHHGRYLRRVQISSRNNSERHRARSSFSYKYLLQRRYFLCTCYHNITQYKSTKYSHILML